MSKTAEKNNIKPDTILKTFWRDNDHFADLFNAALFDGEQVLCPADLTEVDTDVSSMVKFNNHAETVQKVLDVVKKTAYGVDSRSPCVTWSFGGLEICWEHSSMGI